MRRFAVWVVAIAIVSMLSLAGPSLAAGSTDPQPDTGIAWGRCPDATLREAGAQCGYLSVPVDYSDPTGPQIQIDVSRILHTATDYQGVVLVNPGGPGEPGLDTAAYARQTLAQEGFTAAANDYDWIGFDPRGVGTSRPALSCVRNYFSPRRPEYVPRTHKLLEDWLHRSAAYARACWTRSSLQAELLRNMTTRDLALDMDSIRQALGQQQITYYGYSYGTYLGQVYATLFPSRVRRLILDSNVNPKNVWYQANLDQDVPFNRNLNLFLGWVAKNHRVFKLGNSERVVSQLFYATQQQLERRPAGGKIGPDEWDDVFLDAGYWNYDWSYLAGLFSAWVRTHGRRVAQALIEQYEQADTPGNDNTFAAYLAVQCSDAPWPRKWSTWSHDNWALYAKAPFTTWANAWFNAPCIYWRSSSHPVAVNGSQIQSALLIDETLDAATPFQGSLEVRRLFPHSVLLAEPGGTSHADSLEGDLCVDRTIADYLANGTLPARKPHAKWDKTCAPLKPPPAASDVMRAAVDRGWGGPLGRFKPAALRLP